MIELNHLQIELSGMHLIEASAGTGKTYAIALLYLRILVELKLEAKQILVVTYTEAATKELRGRIRRRIREALDVVDGGDTEDALLRALCDNENGGWEDRRVVRDVLDRALKSFDTAAIFTIHGFCLRALKENAFESGSRYDTELVTDQTDLLREVVDDFWRKSFFNDSADLLGYALKKKISSDSLRTFVKGMVGNPMLKIIPEFSPDQITALDSDCQSAFSSLKEQWHNKRQEVVDLITNDKGLSRSADTYKEPLLPGYFAQMDLFTAGSNYYDLPSDFSKFSSSGIASGTKPKGTAPAHSFFEQCEKLQQMVQGRLRLLCGELVAYCQEQLPLRKQQNNIRFFDDLLNDLYKALGSDSGEPFAAKLRTSYQAALIDEFQDTDPIQYEIFRKIYADTSSPLFLIGDPKQAIYSFRGADIFAYIQAAGDVQEDKRFTLTKNWRSTPDLLTAFNQVFSNDRKPFIYKQIEYHPVAPGKDSDKKLISACDASSPLQVWLMPSDDLNVTRANGIIPGYVAAEICQLLQEGTAGTALIGDQPVAPGDIAVIVRTHMQALSIRDALAPLGIPCVMRSGMTIFATDEAREVCTLMQGLLNPGSEAHVRAALVTDVLGRSGSDIARLLEDEQAWETCLEQFREYHQAWHDKGFMVMTRLFMDREAVRGRLLRYPDGERRLTNLLHCFEVIHGKAHERGVGMEELVTWFSERTGAKEKKEEHEIRLETDEKAVKILTIHVSKGLEYPVVFCPYMWSGIRGGDEVVTFHDGSSMVKDYGSTDIALHKKLEEKEQLAESLRLLYVAITRAKYRCYLYGGKVNSKSSKSRPETSPLAYLFHASPLTHTAEDLVGQLAQDFLGLSAETVIEQMQQLAADSNGTISADQLPDYPDVGSWQPYLDTKNVFKCREFEGTIRSDWRVTSFTAFAAHDAKSVELPDRDESLSENIETKQKGEELADGMNIFTFPRGAKAGIFMHAIFEELNFAAPVLEKIIDKNFDVHGFHKDWQPCICDMVTNVITTPLSALGNTFTLSDLKEGSWLPELEFFFPLKFVTSEQLHRSLKGYVDGYEAVNLDAVLSSLQFWPVRGMVRGFIDMVFEHGGRYYLLDWKSNHLGYSVEDYSQEAMKREMVRNRYPLQYLLYTVALNLYLSLRVIDYDYEKHFGGVFYLFLRGMNGLQEGQLGVFRDLPPVDLVKALTEGLVDAGGVIRHEA